MTEKINPNRGQTDQIDDTRKQTFEERRQTKTQKRKIDRLKGTTTVRLPQHGRREAGLGGESKNVARRKTQHERGTLLSHPPRPHPTAYKGKEPAHWESISP